MDFKTFMQCAEHLPSNISVMLRGPHGIGKSQGVHTLGVHFGLPVIDKRLSQMSEGDMIGLPKVDGNVTKFLPPDWYREACDSPRILFLDELNRATPEVMQAAFQVVLDRQLNGHVLHPETRVYAAINDDSQYQVNEMDPALLDRFWTVDLRPTPEDWLEWAKDKSRGNLHENVYNFIATNQRFLDPAAKDKTKVDCSRRSWERLNHTLVASDLINSPENALMHNISRGFVGDEAAVAFVGYVKNFANQVSAEDILFNYDKNRKKIQALGQEKWNICIDKIEQYVEKNNLTDEAGVGMGKFVNDIPPELVVVLWTKMLAGGEEKLDNIKIVHKNCVNRVLEIFEDEESTKKVLDAQKAREEAEAKKKADEEAKAAAKPAKAAKKK